MKKHVDQAIYNKYIKPHLDKMSAFDDDCFYPLSTYSGSDYLDINTFLLADQDEKAYKAAMKKHGANMKDIMTVDGALMIVEEIDDCFKDEAPVTKDDGLILWRGMKSDLGMKIGDTILLKNYVSCTYDIETAFFFMADNHKCCLYQIHVDKGVPYFPMDEYSKQGHFESEVLLPRNLIMTYLRDEKVGGKTGKHSNIPYEITLRHMKISKLDNEAVKDEQILNLGEPASASAPAPPPPPQKKAAPVPVAAPPQKKAASPVYVQPNMYYKYIHPYQGVADDYDFELMYYTGLGYLPINTFLLNDQNVKQYEENAKKMTDPILKTTNAKRLASYIEKIDECFEKKAPVTKDDGLMLWRGMKSNLGMKIGDTILLKNYVSCTYDTEVAYNFMNLGHICCLYAIHVDKDVSYLPMEEYSKSAEAEVLLQRNLLMTYMRDEKKKFNFKYAKNKEVLVRHMKISKLDNDGVKEENILNMAEPVSASAAAPTQPAAAVAVPMQNVAPAAAQPAAPKPGSPTSYTPQPGKRCKNGTQKAKDGRCHKKTVKAAPAPKAAPAAAPAAPVTKPAPPAPQPAAAPKPGSPTSYTPQPGKRCKNGTQKAKDGRCRKKNVAAAAPKAAVPAAAPSQPKAAPAHAAAQPQQQKCKEGEEISQISGKCIKKCPPGKVRNPDTGRCKNK